MAIPTRFIDKEDFEKLIREVEGDTIIRFQLEAFDFRVQRPDEPADFVDRNATHMHILFLNVFEPCLHRDSAGDLLVLLPDHGTFDYDDWRDIHPNKNAWYYVLSPHGWDSENWTHELDDADFYFVEHELGPIDREDRLTH